MRYTTCMLGVAVLLLPGCGHVPRTSTVESPPPAETQNQTPILPDRMDSIVTVVLVERQAPGAAVAIVRRGELVFAQGYGLADQASARPVKVETIFQLASLTKPFTAMAVLLLIEEGKVGLDAPAKRYLPWLPKHYVAITVRQLLTHTSGVARDLRRENVDEFPPAEFRRRLEAAPASFTPGAKWEYSNTGYTLLSLIAEATSGQEFGAFLDARIFRPLGMVRTGYRVPKTGDDAHAVGYDLVEGELIRAPHVFSGWGNSGIESTVLDIAKWAAAIQSRSLLQPGSYAAMFTPARLGSGAVVEFPFGGAPSSYGFGWFLTRDHEADLITHGGAITGFSSIVNWFPKEELMMIVLSNGKQGPDRRGQADGIARAIADALRAG